MFAARGGDECNNGVWTAIGKCMTLGPNPQVFDKVEIGDIGRRECQFDHPIETVDGIADQGDRCALSPSQTISRR